MCNHEQSLVLSTSTISADSHARITDEASHGPILQVTLDQDAFGIEPTEPGRLMAHNYIRLRSMIAIMQVPSHASIPDLLMVIASSSECSHIKLRRGEKRLLNGINKQLSQDSLQRCIVDEHKASKAKERISTGPEKIFIMVGLYGWEGSSTACLVNVQS